MDAYDDEWADSDFEEDPSTSDTSFEYKPSYVLIAVDTDKSMFANNSESETIPFGDSLNVCYSIVDSMVVASQQSLKGPIGIVFADNDNTKTDFIDFEQPLPSTIKMLKDIKTLSNAELESKYERKGNFDLADFFLLCKNKLLNVKTSAYKRTVVYITNDDNPVENDPQRRFKVINESEKFANNEIQLIIVTFKINFDEKNCYSEIISASKSEPVEKIDCSRLTDKLSYLIQKKTIKRKAKFYPFNGNTNSYIEISCIKPTASGSLTKNMYVTRDTKEEVKKKKSVRSNASGYMCTYSKDEEGLIINEGERQILGETSIPVGYTLLYVANPVLQPGWVLTPPYLMQKDSRETQELFEMFWQYCRDNKKCLVCYQKLKSGSNVRFVELIPKFINNVRQFMVKILPFAPEIHYKLSDETTENNTCTKDEENAMLGVIDKLSFDYDVEDFLDPVESKKKAYVKSQLLEQSMEKLDDGMVTDDIIDDRISSFVKVLEKLNTVPTKKRPLKTESARARKK